MHFELFHVVIQPDTAEIIQPLFNYSDTSCSPYGSVLGSAQSPSHGFFTRTAELTFEFLIIVIMIKTLCLCSVERMLLFIHYIFCIKLQ